MNLYQKINTQFLKLLEQIPEATLINEEELLPNCALGVVDLTTGILIQISSINYITEEPIDRVGTISNVEIDIDFKEAQVHFGNKVSLTLPVEDVTMSTSYILLTQIKSLINYIERMKHGTNSS